jgi:hypothetical protein
MPEPLTLTLASVTVISVAVCVYKSIDRVLSAPRETIKQTGQSAEELVRTFAAELRKLFGSEPRISVNRRIVQTGGEAIRELALYKETVLINEEWTNTSWKSTKRLHVQQPFALKAGFDLNRLKFEVDPVNREVTATISESTIVNIEYAGDYEVLKQEHGFWNRITARERDTILNSLPQKAKEEAEALQLRDKAAEQLRALLQPILPPGFRLQLKCADDTIRFEDKPSLANIPGTTLALLGFEEARKNLAPTRS